MFMAVRQSPLDSRYAGVADAKITRDALGWQSEYHFVISSFVEIVS